MSIPFKLSMPNSNNVNKPKIALIHFSGPPLIAGVELILRDHARIFRQFNYKVEIIVGAGKQFRKDISVHTVARMDSANKFVLKVQKELANNHISSTFRLIEKNLYTYLKKYLLTHKIDICIVHNIMTRHYNLPLTSALVQLSNDLPHIKFVTWVHDISFADITYSKVNPLLAKEYPWSLLVTPLPNWYYVCISDFRKKELIATFNGNVPRKIITISNGIDVGKFFGLSPQIRTFYKEIGGIESDLIACMPVRVIKRKNLELGIKIAHEMVRKNVNFKLIITGNTDHHQLVNLEYYGYLKALVKELALEKNVFFLTEFLKTIPNNNHQIDVRQIYQISDFLLMTSSIEGFGLPLLEAGLSRTPIFASDIKPFHEIGTTNIHYFSTAAHPRKLAEIILNKMKSFPQAYFYRKVIKKYSLQHIFKTKILPFIDEVVKDA